MIAVSVSKRCFIFTMYGNYLRFFLHFWLPYFLSHCLHNARSAVLDNLRGSPVTQADISACQPGFWKKSSWNESGDYMGKVSARTEIFWERIPPDPSTSSHLRRSLISRHSAITHLPLRNPGCGPVLVRWDPAKIPGGFMAAHGHSRLEKSLNLVKVLA